MDSGGRVSIAILPGRSERCGTYDARVSAAGEVSPSVAPLSAPPRTRAIVARIVLIAVAARVALEAAGLLSIKPFVRHPLRRALSMWVVWDAGHYLRIAKVGYRPHDVRTDDPLFIVFFPGYPIVVRLVTYVIRNFVLSGLLVSFVASVAAGVLLYKLVRLDADHPEAWRAVILLFTFPTAFFLAAPYSEALFLFVVLAAVYAARTSRWVRTGLAGALATGTRVAGIALVPALAYAAFRSSPSWTVRSRRLALVGVMFVGLLAYIAINLVVHDDPLWFLHVQRSHWYQEAVPPWEPIITAVRKLIEGQRDSAYTLIYTSRLAAFAFAIPMLVLASRRLPRMDAIYGWSGFVLVCSTSWLISLPRYLLPLYPIFMVEAKLTRSRKVFWPIVVIGAMMQAFMFWRHVRGDWAF